MRDDSYAVHFDGRLNQFIDDAGDRLARLFCQFAFGVAQFVLQHGNAAGKIVRLRCLEQHDQFLQQVFRFTNVGQRPQTGQCGDSPHALGDRLFADDFTQSNLTGVRQMDTAAQFGAEFADADHANSVGIFLTEQRHRPRLACLR